MLRAWLCAVALGLFESAWPAEPVQIQAPLGVAPIQFAVGDLHAALAASGYEIGARPGARRIIAAVVGTPGLPAGVKVPDQPESFTIVPRPGAGRLFVIGRDATGAMYGLLELAESVKRGTALDKVRGCSQAPFTQFRAPNPFFSLPDPVVDDWDHWWFRSEDFWRTYLDLLARARFNWIDLHGMLHIRGRWSFPAIYPYFVDSRSFPEVGIDDAQKARNLAMLRRVIAMARDRGIKIALMSYTTSWNVPGAAKAPYPETEENLARYTRECVAELLRNCPDLGMIGFRIGESGKSEGFFKQSYLPGVVDSGLAIPIHTRTWLSSKPKILELGNAYPGRLTIEIKYNGEHFGLPYHVAGGRMAAWHSYSYQDYLRPPEPYQVVWQNRASGTHRLWRWGNPDWVARCVRSYRLGGAAGFSLEPPNAYRPNYDYYHRRSDLKWFRWVPQRDWFWYTLWGRLAYNPDIGRQVWLTAFGERFGRSAAEPMLRASERMSMVIPLIYCAHCQGPDHLNMAPEFETGGSLADFASVPPLDTLTMQSIPEYVQRLVSGRMSARTSPLEMADMIESAATDAQSAIRVARRSATTGLAEVADWEADITCLDHLGTYYAAKLRAATALSFFRATRDPYHLGQARVYAAKAVEAWRELARVTGEFYQPFVESMRPRTEQFRWSDLTPSVEADLAVIDQVKTEVEAEAGDVISGVRPRHLAPLRVAVSCTRLASTPERKTFRIRAAVRAREAGGHNGAAYLYQKPLPSETRWRKRQMAWRGGAYQADLEVSPVGREWAVEVVTPDAGALWPDWRRETPYRVIEAWDGPVRDQPAPHLPDLTRLDLSRQHYSAVLCGRVASVLNAASEEEKRAVLQQVAAGQTLVIFDQDYPAGFDPSWLPGGIRGTDDDYDELKPLGSHPLLRGLPSVVRFPKIVNDALAGGDDQWLRLTDPWGLSIREHGKGRIILLQIRVEQTYEFGPSARLARNVIDYARAGNPGPMLILDEGDGELLTALDALGCDDYVVASDLALR